MAHCVCGISACTGGVLYTNYLKVGIVYMGLRTQSRQGHVQRHVFWTECRRLCGPHDVGLCALWSAVLLMGYVGRDIAVLHVVHACAHGAPWAAYCKERVCTGAPRLPRASGGVFAVGCGDVKAKCGDHTANGHGGPTLYPC